MDTPIINKLKKMKDKNPISFHTPGHKGKSTLLNWKELIPEIDITEIPGMDNLHDPRGIIKESQSLAAKTFGAKDTLYSVNGTTGGIYIALGAITNPGDKILIQRNSHKSIYNGAILNRLNIEYVYPNYNENYGIFTGVDPYIIEEKLKEDLEIKAVVLTYPDYYGICSNIKRIAEIVHKYDRILLVDEAHGSHFIFSDKLPISALKAGADITVQSIHKTLPSFTQTSMIHLGTNRVDIKKLKTMSSLYQTTSPSYLFMASLEMARAYMEGKGIIRLEENIMRIHELTKELEKIPRAYLFTGDEEDNTIFDKDTTKVLFRIDGITGTKVSNILREDYNIYLEMEDINYCLALTSLMNEERDFNLLSRAIEEIANKIPYEEINTIIPNMLRPNIVLPIYEAFYKNRKVLDLKEALGKISASFITPYPPGIPLLCPGERITEELVEYMRFLMDKGIEIMGLIGYNREKMEAVD
ncbi:aminotransferase class I/II-fold pyridoxal phosphate-dependent enzyme [Clostridium sp. Cult2]|uniref:aminotransferase class I/II-fold pyridoxal phosphate-dependent enzyme n=1 Tax=Clostridium sp. Cult2 TaxID=2079003 RepID=UPI001F0102A6|nr:aminotransferase class I/II-fold pyridoxal phosphate-dependent enzyme [Clostridium sp. Cult2]MCF6464349.1 arginine / lysine / ornithine decarboxylase [Clostridium sp. Cult2]